MIESSSSQSGGDRKRPRNPKAELTQRLESDRKALITTQDADASTQQAPPLPQSLRSESSSSSSSSFEEKEDEEGASKEKTKDDQKEERITWSPEGDKMLCEFAAPMLITRKSDRVKVRDLWKQVFSALRNELEIDSLGMKKLHLLTPLTCRNRWTKLLVSLRNRLKSRRLDVDNLGPVYKLVYEFHEMSSSKRKFHRRGDEDGEGEGEEDEEEQGPESIQQAPFPPSTNMHVEHTAAQTAEILAAGASQVPASKQDLDALKNKCQALKDSQALLFLSNQMLGEHIQKLEKRVEHLEEQQVQPSHAKK